MTKLTKRLRYEILRRDGHTCRYCGGKAPDVELHVDHVIPQALGGGNDPGNLVAACKDCNSGKASTPADAELVADADATAVLFARAMAVAKYMQQSQRSITDRQVDAFDAKWVSWRVDESDGTRSDVPRDDEWRDSIEHMLAAGLDLDDLLPLVDVAMKASKKRSVPLDELWRYFCGCAWRRLRERQDLARKLIDEGELAPAEDGDDAADVEPSSPDRSRWPSPLPAAVTNPHAGCPTCDGNRWVYDEKGVIPCPSGRRNLQAVGCDPESRLAARHVAPDWFRSAALDRAQKARATKESA